jgi:hypothetical protein
VHADIGWFIGALAVALVIGLRPVALWIFVLRLYLSIRKGGSVDNTEAGTGRGYAVTPAA